MRLRTVPASGRSSGLAGLAACVFMTVLLDHGNQYVCTLGALGLGAWESNSEQACHVMVRRATERAVTNLVRRTVTLTTTTITATTILIAPFPSLVATHSRLLLAFVAH